MSVCRSCKSKNLQIDDHTEDTYCSDCGIVQEFANYQHHFGGISGTEGTFVRLGTSGSGTNYSYKDRKFFESNQIIEDITFRLNFTDARTREVKTMAEKVTEGEFGIGDWFYVLVGACSYIVMRLSNKTLPISEVVEVVGCDLYEMGKMVNRVVDFLGLELPEFDIVGLFERTLRGFSGFKEVDEEKVEVMVKQGTFLVQCAIKWFLTTGRRPGPVVVAVLVFVATVNGVRVRIEDVAKEANAAITTCKMRYKELLEKLVEVARALPWGKDVNVKNVVKNAPFVMKYMEMKSMESRENKRRRVGDEIKGFALEGVIEECLSKEVEYGDLKNRSGCLNKKQDEDGLFQSNASDLENAKVSHEDLAKLYSKLKADAANCRLMNVNEGGQYRDETNGQDLRLFDEWWSGRSDLCTRLMLQQLQEKDVGLDALPPSYIRGCRAVKRRQEKIRAAKMRISSIVCPPKDISSEEIGNLETRSSSRDDHCNLQSNNSQKKRRKQFDDIDWEDFIIETLLLHQVKEEEIEKGYYNALLGVHVFKSGLI